MSEDKVKVDVIVIGGGPAGMAAAHVIAKAGLEVIVLERGESCGTKSVGGLLYATVLNKIIPEAHRKAPIERPVSKRSLRFLGGEECLTLEFGSEVWSRPPFNNTYIVHRSLFDKWFAGETERTGANLLEGTVADEILIEGEGLDRRASGVRVRGDECFYADMVILAEGAHPILQETLPTILGMKPGKRHQEYVVGVKEIIRLPKEKIEDRFQLGSGEGMAVDFFGVPFEGVVGGGFIYTAKDTLHVGFAARTDSIVKSKLNPSEVMDRFKNHREVKKLIGGGELVEYSAHLIPEGGYAAIPQLSANGLMVAGDAAGLVNMSLYKEGTNHAMESGRCAGETAIEAKRIQNYSRSSLRRYEERLLKGNAMKDMKKYRRVPFVLAHTPDLFDLYPKKAANLLVDYFSVLDESKSKIQRDAVLRFLKGLPKFRFVRDMIRAKNMC